MDLETPDSLRDIAALNRLLRREIAAVEVYTQALSYFDDPTLIADLQAIRDEHSRAVRELRERVVEVGAAPVDIAGTWSSFSLLVIREGNRVTSVSVLTALRQGEEQGITEYRAAIENQLLPADCGRLIGTDLLPALSKHLTQLDQLLGRAGCR